MFRIPVLNYYSVAPEFQRFHQFDHLKKTTFKVKNMNFSSYPLLILRKRPVFLLNIMRNLQKMLFAKLMFSIRVFKSENEGTVEIICYDRVFVKNHVHYNKGPLYTFLTY